MNTFTEGNIFDYVRSTNGGAKIADFHQIKASTTNINSSPNTNLDGDTQSTITNGPSKNNNAWIYWTLGAIAVGAIVVGIHYHLKRNREKTEHIKKSYHV